MLNDFDYREADSEYEYPELKNRSIIDELDLAKRKMVFDYPDADILSAVHEVCAPVPYSYDYQGSPARAASAWRLNKLYQKEVRHAFDKCPDWFKEHTFTFENALDKGQQEKVMEYMHKKLAEEMDSIPRGLTPGAKCWALAVRIWKDFPYKNCYEYYALTHVLFDPMPGDGKTVFEQYRVPFIVYYYIIRIYYLHILPFYNVPDDDNKHFRWMTHQYYSKGLRRWCEESKSKYYCPDPIPRDRVWDDCEAYPAEPPAHNLGQPAGIPLYKSRKALAIIAERAYIADNILQDSGEPIMDKYNPSEVFAHTYPKEKLDRFIDTCKYAF